jgi:hypothetical protein
MLDGVVLVVAGLPGATAGFKGNVGEAIAPVVGFAKGSSPLVRRGLG